MGRPIRASVSETQGLHIGERDCGAERDDQTYRAKEVRRRPKKWEYRLIIH